MNNLKFINVYYRILIPLYVAFIVMSSITEPTAKEVTILNIAAYHVGYEWTDECVKGIESKLKNKYNLITIYMDTKRLSKDLHSIATEKAWNRYLEIKPDLVMLGDDNALSYLGPKFANTKTPVVFYGVNGNPRNPFEDKTMPENITGVLERVQYFPIVRVINKLLGNTKNVLILSDDSSTSKAIIETTLDGKEMVEIINTKMHLKIITTYSQWQKVIVAASSKYDAIFLSTFYTIKDEKNNIMDYLKILKWSSNNTKIPMFGSSELMVRDDGAIGAFVIVGEKHGQTAAEIAQKVLQNRKVERIKMDKKCQLIFNKKQLEKFNFELPKDIEKKSIFK